jgi:uncharacterized protein with HEPN domain
MRLSDIDFLRHILQEAEYCLSELKVMTRDDLFTNDRLSRALVRSLEIIGEATKKNPSRHQVKISFYRLV